MGSADRGAAVLNKKGIMMTESVVKVENEKNLLTAFVAGFKNMFDFKTRASKYDYWAFVFANVLIGFVVLGVSAVLAMILTSTFLFWTFLIAYYVYSLVESVAVLALTVRRLHDTNHSGKILWLPLVFGLGIALGTVLLQHMKNIGVGLFAASTLVLFGVALWIFILCLRKGRTEENRFGKPVNEAVEYNKFANIYIIAYLVINVVAGVISFISESDDNQLSAANQNTNTVVSETETTAAEAVNDAKNETKPETQTENSEETETPNVPMHESAE